MNKQCIIVTVRAVLGGWKWRNGMIRMRREKRKKKESRGLIMVIKQKVFLGVKNCEEKLLKASQLKE